jgi:hypothetical protein
MRFLRIVSGAVGITAGVVCGVMLRGAATSVAHAAPAVLTEGAADAVAVAEVQPETLPGVPFDFKRPFVVPILEGWRTESLVVVSLRLHLEEADAKEAGAALEARLRDSITQRLNALAAEGRLAAHVEEAALEALVEAAAREAADERLAEAPAAVVVTEIARRRV